MIRRLADAVAWPAAGAVAVLAAWWAATDWFGVQGYLLPRPQDVASTLVELRGYLAEHTVVTLWEVTAGYALAVAGGVAAGLVLATWRPAWRALGPLLVALHAVPKLPLAVPLVIAVGCVPGPHGTMVGLAGVSPGVRASAASVQSSPA